MRAGVLTRRGAASAGNLPGSRILTDSLRHANLRLEGYRAGVLSPLDNGDRPAWLPGFSLSMAFLNATGDCGCKLN
jgi:hypothetical protein